MPRRRDATAKGRKQREQSTPEGKASREIRGGGGGAKGGERWPPVLVLSVITAVIAVPRGMQVGFTWMHLHSGWFRPPVKLNQERPLLVVGTMGATLGLSPPAPGLRTPIMPVLSGAFVGRFPRLLTSESEETSREAGRRS